MRRRPLLSLAGCLAGVCSLLAVSGWALLSAGRRRVETLQDELRSLPGELAALALERARRLEAERLGKVSLAAEATLSGEAAGLPDGVSALLIGPSGRVERKLGGPLSGEAEPSFSLQTPDGATVLVFLSELGPEALRTGTREGLFLVPEAGLIHRNEAKDGARRWIGLAALVLAGGLSGAGLLLALRFHTGGGVPSPFVNSHHPKGRAPCGGDREAQSPRGLRAPIVKTDGKAEPAVERAPPPSAAGSIVRLRKTLAARTGFRLSESAANPLLRELARELENARPVRDGES